MKTVKYGLLATVAVLGACSCVKSPDLAVAPAVKSSAYTATTSTASMNEPSVKEMFAAGGFNKVYFDYDSAVIRDDAAATLQRFAEFAKEHDVRGVTIEGHCDERGTREYNLALGDRRAVAVKRYLVGLGLDGSQVTTISYGKERPAVDGHTEAAWAKNRRGVIVLN